MNEGGGLTCICYKYGTCIDVLIYCISIFVRRCLICDSANAMLLRFPVPPGVPCQELEGESRRSASLASSGLSLLDGGENLIVEQ